MKEYEYSFKVNDINPFINYCKNNGYILENDNLQIRELFKNKNKILARITTEIINDEKKYILDFKDDNDTDILIKEARETFPLKVRLEDRKALDSILDILDFSKDVVLKRKRVTYVKNKVKFEIDEYMEPEIFYVVAIEGEKNLVDNVYLDIKNKIKEVSDVQ